MYDVFISFKNTDSQGNQTEDSHIAKEIYAELKRRSINTFFSNHELKHDGWWQEICEALEQARILVLVGTSIDYIRSGQVKREWSLFLNLIASGRKPGCELHAYWKDIDFYSLKRDEYEFTLKNIHDINSLSIARLCDNIQNILPKKASASKLDNYLYVPKNNRKSDRFKYTTGYTILLGRDNEVNCLKRFCTETNYPISWMALCGKGGIGKSKLAYDFCKLMEEEGWKVFYPQHAKSLFKDDLVGVDRDCLICFDYVKFEIDIIEDIIQLVIDRRIRYKVRFILIDRDEREIKDGFSSVVEEYHYPDGNLILNTTGDEELVRIIENYIRNIGYENQPNDVDKKNMLNTLELIDPGIKRPLFALFIADAWIDNCLNLKDWNRERAVSYVANKELRRIYSIATNYAKTPADKTLYLEILNLTILFATLCEGVAVSDAINLLKCLSYSDEKMIYKLLNETELIDGNIIRGIEPDLIGEYICIKILNDMKKEMTSRLFDELYKVRFTDVISYIDKIYEDYTDELLCAEWSSHVTRLELPRSYTYVKNNMFNGCGFIHEVKLHDRVTTISKGGFRDCDHLQKINFPDNLEVIESAAFLNCFALEIAMPDDGKGWVPSIISIGDRAFKNCRNLIEFRLPSSVREIGTEIFAKCKSLKKVEIPREINLIPHNAFEACESLEEILIRNSSKEGISIQSEAFKGCSSLKRIENSRAIMYIGKSGFENCRVLKAISFGPRLTDFGEDVFKGCTGFETIDLTKSNIRRLSKSAFEGCTDLSTVLLPQSLSYIGAKAFYNCSNLNAIILPESIRTVSELVFCGCTKLCVNSFGSNLNKIKNFSSFHVNKIDDDFIKFITGYFFEKEVCIPDSVYKIGDRAFLNDKDVEKVVFHKYIDGIGRESFRGCTHLKRIDGTFSGIKTIGAGSFWGCKELEKIPDDAKIRTIADNLFKYCLSLKSLKLDSEIESIGKMAFYHCVVLKRIFFKGKCNHISSCAFEGCPDFTLSTNHHIKKKDDGYYVSGFIFKKFDREEMYFVKKYTEWENVRIPSSCIGFFENPFEGSTGIKHLSVPNSVKSLIKYNFANITSLESIALPNTIKVIPEGAFNGCVLLKNVKMNGRINYIRERIKIGKRAFANCESLQVMELPVGLRKIEEGVFSGCKNLENIILNDDLVEIGNQAFMGCTALSSIPLPSTIQKIGFQAFEDCLNLENVYGLENTGIETLPNEIFQGCIRLKNVQFPTGLKSIGAHAFYDCKHIEEISIFRTDVEYIGVAAFQNCYMLSEMVLPRKIRIIEKFMFKSCTQLRRIKIPPILEEIRTSAFFGCNMLEEIALHNKKELSKIDNDVFAGCHKLENVILPANLKRLSRGLFRGCVSLKRVEIPSSVTEIPVDCFKDCKQLTEFVVSNPITSVGAGSFRNCFELADITFIKNAYICEVAAFRGCINIREVTFDRINTIAPALFMGCKSLKRIAFPVVEQIDNYAFYGCDELTDIPIINAKFRIGDGAFWNCFNLKDIAFSDLMNDIQPSAFRNCRSIEEVRFPRGIQRIYAASFRGADHLSEVYIPDTVAEIHKSAFKECISLETVEIESGYVKMEETVFGGCRNLYYFVFSGNIKAHLSAFEETPVEEDLKKDSRIEWVEKKVRLRSSNLKMSSVKNNISASKAAELYLYSIIDGDICLNRYLGRDNIVTIPDSINGLTVIGVGDACFEDRRDLIEINLPISIESIGKNAFAGCKSLDTIEIPENVKTIGAYAFKWCSKITELAIPDGVTVISEGMFMCCYSLEKVVLPINTEFIGEGAFWRCENLKLTVPESADIDTGAFKGVNRENINSLHKLDDRFFEEWPYGEEVISSEYGHGVVTKCDYIDKTSHDITIHFEYGDINLEYPNEFNASMKFTSERSIHRHQEMLTKLQQMTL